MGGRNLMANQPIKKGRNLMGTAIPVAAPPMPSLTGTPSQFPAPPIAGVGQDGSDLQWNQTGYEQPVQPQQQQTPMALSEVAMQSLSNIPSSAAQFAEDTIQPLISPVETAGTLGSLALNVLRKAGADVGDPNDAKAADAVGKFLEKRYVGAENFKRTLAKDPVGVLADLSMIFSLGGTGMARIPGAVGQVGKTINTVGRAIDPLSNAVKVAKPIASLAGKYVAAPVAKAVFGTTTGAGGQAISEAANAGFKGGDTGRAFQNQMRGVAAIEDVVTDAKTALSNMKQERAIEYRSGMDNLGKVTEIIDFAPIDSALNKVSEVGSFKGQVIKPTAVGAMDEIRTAIEKWKTLDPAEFHTPEGLDALKQQIGSIGDSYDIMTQKQARIISDQAYNAIKAEIVKQAPEYAKMMKKYEEASELIRDIEKTLSVNPKANVDTIVRKLQSVMRNNANTNYGRRADLAAELSQRGAPDLLPKLAGQSLSSAVPRGLQGAATIPAAAVLGMENALMLPALAATSPRLIGEAAYYGGKAANAAKRGYNMSDALLGKIGMTPRGIGAGAFQSGRANEEMNNALGAR